MKKLLLIKLAALSAAVTASGVLASCDMGALQNGSSDPAATTTIISTTETEPESTPSDSATEPTLDPNQPNAPGIDYKAAKSIKKETTEKKKTYSSTNADESALIVNGKKIKVSLTNPVIKKSGDSDAGDHCRLYGVNAAFLTMGGSSTLISGGTVTADGKGASGVFAYGGFGEQNGISGDGTTLNISDTTIKTTGANAGGLVSAKGAKTTASNLTVTTSGESSPAIATANTGENVKVKGGTFTTEGVFSPAIYATATASISNKAVLTANKSAAVVVDGKNANVTLADTTITANHTKRNDESKFFSSFLVHQSKTASGETGTTTLTISYGTITSKKGHVFHVTNTNGIINLSNVTIVNEDPEKVILSVSPDGWRGNENVAVFNVTKSALEGKILVAKKGKLTVNFSNGATFTGTFSGDIKSADGEEISKDQGVVYVNLGADCKWTLTEDTYITSFAGDMNNVDLNGHSLYVNGDTITPTPGGKKKPTATPKPKRPTSTPKPKKKKATATPKPKKKATPTKKPTPKQQQNNQTP